MEDCGFEGEQVWLAFTALSPRRASEQGSPKHISIEAIWCYIDLVLGHITEDEVEDLLYLLQKLDDKFMEIQLKKLEKSRKRTQKGQKSGGRR